TLNIGNFVTLKLTSSNYLLWETQVLSLIECQDLMGFVNTTTMLKPPVPSYADVMCFAIKASRQNNPVQIWLFCPPQLTKTKIREAMRLILHCKTEVLLNLLIAIFKLHSPQQRSQTLGTQIPETPVRAPLSAKSVVR
ncbi:hypothetical protein CFOL_v3_03077, partial [Cephalotus follicularis]